MCRGRVIRDGALVIEGQTIVDVGKNHELKGKYRRGYDKIDAQGKIVIPGLINTHQHAAMSLLRGYADDLPLQEWLEKWIWPVEKLMTPHDVYVGASLTAIESILNGVTTLNTMYHYSPQFNEARAFAEAGLRGVVGHVCFSWRKTEDQTALHHLASDWHNKIGGLIRVSVDPHSPFTVDPQYMKELAATKEDLNSRYGSDECPIIMHTHIAETQDEKRKIERAFNVKLKNGVMAYLDSLDVLDRHFLAAHCVHMLEKDITIIGRRQVNVSHNPISNLKLGSGISPVPKMLEEGITVSLGTDSPSSNNSADMFETMKMAALLHKGVNRDPTLVPATQVLEMATILGARALSWEKDIGSIEPGKKADLVIIDFKKPHYHPMHNETSHLVYVAKSGDVDTSIIDGRIVMERRQLTTLDAQRIVRTAEKASRRLLEQRTRTAE